MKVLKAINGLCLVTTLALAVWLAGEHRASSRLVQANQAMRQELARSGEVAAENERLSVIGRTAAPGTSESESQGAAPTTHQPTEELARLRREVQKLRGQSHEIEALRIQTAQLRVQHHAAEEAGSGNPSGSGAGGLEILQATYGTDHTNMDVGDALRDRIRGGSLKAIASNNLKGDPEFGQVKHLTLVYRLNGNTFTNDFHEGDFIIIPNEQQNP